MTIMVIVVLLTVCHQQPIETGMTVFTPVSEQQSALFRFMSIYSMWADTGLLLAAVRDKVMMMILSLNLLLPQVLHIQQLKKLHSRS